jgi:hypothetical protein
MGEGGGVNRLFCFGLGYTAEVLARRLQVKGWSIAGTAREPANIERLRAAGFDVARFTGEPSWAAAKLLPGSTHLLHSIPPQADGDPVLADFGDALADMPELAWVGYLSTVGVYGDHAGACIDEAAELKATSARTRARIDAERSWLSFGAKHGVPVQIFRLAGIYGPGRSALDKVKAGTARRIVKPGQVFNRIHVDDIATVLEASMAKSRPGAIYNVADDEPAAPDEVIAYAAELLGLEPPPEVQFEEAELSPMARSFYGDNRRISNSRIKTELGVTLRYPAYREGLRALLSPCL